MPGNPRCWSETPGGVTGVSCSSRFETPPSGGRIPIKPERVGVQFNWFSSVMLGARQKEPERQAALSGGRAKVMSKVDELKTEIERLSREEVTELVRWLSEKDWERWDKEIEADSEAGRLDFLTREALDEIAKGTRTDL